MTNKKKQRRELARWFRAAVRETGRSREEMAEELGVDTRRLGKLERGQAVPGPEIIDLVAKSKGVSAETRDRLRAAVPVLRRTDAQITAGVGEGRKISEIVDTHEKKSAAFIFRSIRKDILHMSVEELSRETGYSQNTVKLHENRTKPNSNYTKKLMGLMRSKRQDLSRELLDGIENALSDAVKEARSSKETDLSKLIKEYMARAGISEATELSRITGIHWGALDNILKGHTAKLLGKTLKKLAVSLDFSRDDIEKLLDVSSQIKRGSKATWLAEIEAAKAKRNLGFALVLPARRFGEIVKREREARRWSIKELSKKTGIAPSMIESIEERSSYVTEERAIKIAKVLHPKSKPDQVRLVLERLIGRHAAVKERAEVSSKIRELMIKYGVFPRELQHRSKLSESPVLSIIYRGDTDGKTLTRSMAERFISGMRLSEEDAAELRRIVGIVAPKVSKRNKEETPSRPAATSRQRIERPPLEEPAVTQWISDAVRESLFKAAVRKAILSEEAGLGEDAERFWARAERLRPSVRKE